MSTTSGLDKTIPLKVLTDTNSFTADMANSIVLVKEIPQNIKQLIENAKKVTVKAILIINNRESQRNFHYPYSDFPVGLISKKHSQLLLNNGKIHLTFNANYRLYKDPNGSQMLPESSWGVTAEGHIKPDIVAPGYDIFSAGEKNKYTYLSGTSMSVPQVAGIMNLLIDHLQKIHPSLTKVQRLELAKQIMLSSASPLVDKTSNTYYSPRQQGVGAINADKALNAKYIVTDKNGQSKINLQSLKSTQLSFSVNVQSLRPTKSPKTLYYQITTSTDKVDGSHFTHQSEKIYDSKWQSLVMTGDTLQVPIQLDLERFTKHLDATRPNGYFIDGFVHFKENLNDQEAFSIPFSGFKGDFTNLPALEEPIYYLKNKESFYKTKIIDNQLNFNHSLDESNGNHYTVLTSHEVPYFLSQDYKNGILPEESSFISEAPRKIVLGAFDHYKEENYQIKWDNQK